MGTGHPQLFGFALTGQSQMHRSIEERWQRGHCEIFPYIAALQGKYFVPDVGNVHLRGLAS